MEGKEVFKHAVEKLSTSLDEALQACNKKIIDILNQLKVKTKLISDGDVSGALMVTDEKYNTDIFLGIGGGPEGVLAASALDTYGCHFQGRFIFDNEKDKLRAKKMGITDLNKKYNLTLPAGAVYRAQRINGFFAGNFSLILPKEIDFNENTLHRSLIGNELKFSIVNESNFPLPKFQTISSAGMDLRAFIKAQ